MPEFVHLHNHTHYSILDSITLPEELVNAAKQDGQKAIALTDHGVMFGIVEFYKAAKNAGIKPILGFEAYIANGSRFEKIAGKSKTKKRNYFHLVLLAKNETGYKNLIKLTSLAHTEGFYYKPRIDRELLEQYHEGIIASSACIAGVVNAHLLNSDYNEAYQAAKYYKDIFGEDFYLELQNHNLPDDKIILTEVPKIANQLDIKLIATNDIHYLEQDHAYAHNVHLFIRDVSSVSNLDVDIYKLRYRTPEMYFKTTDQMAELFADFPEAIDNTLEIADKCNCEIDTTRHMPEFKIPENSKAKNLNEYLKEVTFEGLEKKFKNLTKEIIDRVEYELDTIIKMGFPGYFLIVKDFIDAAKKMDVSVGPGRGSAAGSLVAYALGITDINPLPYDLLFERFLNPERISMPDIDIDFEDSNRDKVINYVKNKYGEKSVAQIITFGKMSSRAVLKDVGRVLGINHNEINEITKKIPVIQGKVTKLKDALNLPELRDFKESTDPKKQELIKFATVLEDKNRTTSIHAAGVVIAPGEITDYVPIYSSNKNKQSLEYISQYSMEHLEEVGLLKMDFLGLKTLTVIKNTIEMIEQNHSIKIDIDNLDLNDKKTWDLLSRGDTLAIFQFESPGMQEYLKELKPYNLEELAAMNALYRPGPMDNIPEFIDRKHRKKPITYLHPIMEKSLKNTYGIIVYQEQVMQLARDIAGYSLGEADLLRRAMGKKKKEIMEKEKPKFIEGSLKNGINKNIANEIYDLIAKFASYGFNKSHSVAYSYLAYRTAWLKANYPAEFLAANMTNEKKEQKKIVELINEAKKFGIEVLPPDINRSYANFTVHNNKIYFGLSAIRNVGEIAVNEIIKERKKCEFKNIFDFISRVDIMHFNKKTLEALICAGAFDSLLDYNRATLYENMDRLLEFAKKNKELEENNMFSMFDNKTNDTINTEFTLEIFDEWNDKVKLEYEKEFLGFYISGHPLDRYSTLIEAFQPFDLGNIDENFENGNIKVCGIIKDFNIKYTRKEQQYATFNISDFNGDVQCFLFSEKFTNYSHYLNDDIVVFAQGNAEMKGKRLSMIIDEIYPLNEALQRMAKGYNIWIDLNGNSINQINELYKISNNASSHKTIQFHIYDKAKHIKKTYVANDVNISTDFDTFTQLVEIFSKDKIRILM